MKYHSHLLDFQEGLGCHMYVEKAHCESNNGFATNFKSGRKVAMVFLSSMNLLQSR